MSHCPLTLYPLKSQYLCKGLFSVLGKLQNSNSILFVMGFLIIILASMSCFSIKKFNQHANKENLLWIFLKRFNERNRVVLPFCLPELTSQLFLSHPLWAWVSRQMCIQILALYQLTMWETICSTHKMNKLMRSAAATSRSGYEDHVR